MRLLPALAAVALLPLLGGCVIYSNEGGEKVSVNVSDQIAAKTETLEAVRKVDFDGQRLNVVVGSNGCTETASFEVKIKDGDPAELTLTRRAPDLCRALVREGVVVSWTYAELGLESGAAVRVMNPISL